MKIQRSSNAYAPSRNSALELLRIVAMLLIVLSHVCVHSGFETQSISLSFNRLLIQWGTLGNLGVDIFVIISGYFLCAKANTTKSLGKLFVQVWFYSVALFVVCWLGFGYDYSWKSLIKAFFPTVFQEYWFFTAYVVLIALSPYLNSFLAQIDKSTLQKLLGISILLWVLIPTFTMQQMYGSEIPQFVMFYMIGAYFRKYPDTCFQRKTFRMSITLSSFALLFLSTLVFELLGTRIPFFANKGILFYGRNSLLIAGCAIGMFVNAIYAKPFTNGVVNSIAGCTFGVYLFHENPAVREILWKGLLPNARLLDSPLLILAMLGSVIGVFVFAIGIEFLRQKTVAKPMLYVFEKTINWLFQRAKVCWMYIAEKMQVFLQK